MVDQSGTTLPNVLYRTYLMDRTPIVKDRAALVAEIEATRWRRAEGGSSAGTGRGGGAGRGASPPSGSSGGWVRRYGNERGVRARELVAAAAAGMLVPGTGAIPVSVDDETLTRGLHLVTLLPSGAHLALR